MLNSQSRNHCRAVGGTLGTPGEGPGEYGVVRWIDVDEEGLVWVLVTVGNADWHRGFAELEETGPDGEPTATLVDYHQVFDSIVEVIDVELSHRYAEP